MQANPRESVLAFLNRHGLLDRVVGGDRDSRRTLYAHKLILDPNGYVFPSVRNASQPMSENTLNVSLRRLGYDKDTMTAHGFRSLASSLLNEQQWNKDAIERHLAHGERDKVRAAYNHAALSAGAAADDAGVG